MKETLIFIDAGFVSKVTKFLGEGRYLKYNLLDFAIKLATKERMTLKQLFFYTAPPYQSNNSQKMIL